MRLFLIGWTGKQFGHIAVAEQLKKMGCEILYWTGSGLEEEVDQSKFPGTIFHEYRDALRARPAPPFAQVKFTPPRPELLRALLATESTILTMMNKLFEHTGVCERKHLYYRYVQYWLHVLQVLEPQAIIFPVAPHTVYDFVLYSLAQMLHIKTIFFMLTRIGDRILLMNDFIEGSVALRKEMEKNKGRHLTVNDLPPDIREYYSLQRAVQTTPTLRDVAETREYYSGFRALRVKACSFWNALAVRRDLSVFTKLVTYLPRRFGPNQKTEYERLCISPDFTKKFVYVALNQQPENTTSPLGGIFVDQILMVEMLSATLPPDWLVYVKEHPLQWKPRGLDYFSYRYRGYYQTLAELPNVRLIPIETDSFSLIDASQCVAGVNGTAGWEAVLRGKPSLVFGYAWYRDCPGVFQVRDAASCRDAIEKINAGRVRVAEQDSINYLFSFNQVSIRALTDGYLLSTATVSREESIKNYTRAILEAL